MRYKDWNIIQLRDQRCVLYCRLNFVASRNVMLCSFTQVAHFSKWCLTLQARDFPPGELVSELPPRAAGFVLRCGDGTGGCPVILMLVSVVCGTKYGLIPATGSLLSSMIGLGEGLRMYQVTPHILRNGNFLLRKFK